MGSQVLHLQDPVHCLTNCSGLLDKPQPHAAIVWLDLTGALREAEIPDCLSPVSHTGATKRIRCHSSRVGLIPGAFHLGCDERFTSTARLENALCLSSPAVCVMPAMTEVTASDVVERSIPDALLGRRALERLDLLLLTVESLDLNGGEAMLWATRQLGFETIFPNRVELWKRRCHNPLRRSTRRGQLSAVETEALIRILCAMADRLYPMLHQLLSSKEPPDLTRQRWGLVHQRLRDLIEERMNLRRGAIQRFLGSEPEGPLLRQLVLTLALSAGPGGVDRLRASLLDPTP